MKIADNKPLVTTKNLTQAGPAFYLRWAGCKRNELSGVFLCTCGQYCMLKIRDIFRGKSSSCGHLNAVTKRRNPLRFSPSSDGSSHQGVRVLRTEYKIWKSMKARCTNPNHKNFHRYGGRGISVCKRWSDSFEAFLMDVGERPSMLVSLDRIDNDGNYEPGNTRWSTQKEQCNNRSPVSSSRG